MSADFIDSNVLVYLFDNTDAVKREAAETLIRSGLDSGNATISSQVVQEVLNVLTHKLRPPASPEEARRFLGDVLVPLWSGVPRRLLYERALELHSPPQFRFYDALIVAAALAAGCSHLYSEDLQHGQRFEGLTIVNPFRA